MTWLPIEASPLSERDAVLGLKSEVYELLRGMLATAWRITDPRLLDICRLRVAQMVGARADISSADGQFLTGLSDWRSSSAFTERERAALGYAEQYHLDHKGITNSQKQELAHYLSPQEVVNFVWALHMNDAYARVLSLLDIEPDSPPGAVRLERLPPNETTAGRQPENERASDESPSAAVDPAFFEAYRALGRAVVRQALVDEVTSEVVRLHNASHQGCQY